jgi:hypothetical protein
LVLVVPVVCCRHEQEPVNAGAASRIGSPQDELEGVTIGYESADVGNAGRLLPAGEDRELVEAHVVGPKLLAWMYDDSGDNVCVSLSADGSGNGGGPVRVRSAMACSWWDYQPLARASSPTIGLVVEARIDDAPLWEGHGVKPSPVPVARVESIHWLDPLSEPGAHGSPPPVDGAAVPVSVWQPALTEYYWDGAGEAGGWLVGSDDGHTAECSAMFLLEPRSEHREVSLHQTLNLPHQFMLGHVAPDGEQTLVTESYTQPTMRYLDLVDRSAGLRLIRLTVSPGGGFALVDVLFTPTLGETAVEVVVAYSFDPLTGDCLFATAFGNPLAPGGGWQAVRLYECPPARGAEARLIAGAALSGTDGLSFTAKGFAPPRYHPPAPVPLWLGRTAAGNVLMVDRDLNVWRWCLGAAAPSTPAEPVAGTGE